MKFNPNGFRSQPVEEIVDECIKKGPADVETWKKAHPEMAAKHDAASCPNPESIAVLKCMKREIVMKCPDWSKTPECDSLMAFAKKCSAYPFPDHHHKDKKKDSNSESDEKEKKTEDPEEE
jgi:hypothetical protein